MDIKDKEEDDKNKRQDLKRELENKSLIVQAFVVLDILPDRAIKGNARMLMVRFVPSAIKRDACVVDRSLIGRATQGLAGMIGWDLILGAGEEYAGMILRLFILLAVKRNARAIQKDF